MQNISVELSISISVLCNFNSGRFHINKYPAALTLNFEIAISPRLCSCCISDETINNVTSVDTTSSVLAHKSTGSFPSRLYMSDLVFLLGLTSFSWLFIISESYYHLFRDS